jgi:propionyl-CoA carboxylase alpha chain
MKMENVLKAESKGVVKTIHARQGANLSVDAIIIEFEKD